MSIADRVPDLILERDRLTAERDAWKERHTRLDRESVDKVNSIAQERDALAGKYDAACWDRECLQKRRDELEAENERLRAELDTLKWGAERKSIAGAQLFHDMQANVECLHANVECLRAELLAEYAKGHRAGYAAGSESLLRDTCDHPRQSCEKVGCRAPIEQRLKSQLAEQRGELQALKDQYKHAQTFNERMEVLCGRYTVQRDVALQALAEMREVASAAVDCVDEEDKRDALRAVLVKQQLPGAKWT